MDFSNYRLIDYRVPKPGETYIRNIDGYPMLAHGVRASYSISNEIARPIVELIEQPETISTPGFSSIASRVYEQPQATISINIDLNTDAALERLERLADAFRD